MYYIFLLPEINIIYYIIKLQIRHQSSKFLTQGKYNINLHKSVKILNKYTQKSVKILNKYTQNSVKILYKSTQKSVKILNKSTQVSENP